MNVSLVGVGIVGNTTTVELRAPLGLPKIRSSDWCAACTASWRKAVEMSFTPVCPASAMSEGKMSLFQVGKKSVLLVWPAGGELRAYRGRCPHADLPLSDASFDGKKVTCSQHQWGFDCTSGKCVTHAVRNALHPYELRLEAGEILVDLGPAKPLRAPA